MKKWRNFLRLTLCSFVLLNFLAALSPAQTQMAPPPSFTPKFTLRKSGAELERRTQAGSFFDVVGRRSAIFGYEHRAFEAWVYPLKILDDFRLSFQLEGYPLEIQAADIAVSINARPEATIFTYTHSAFTARQIIFAPVDEPGIVMLLDVQSVLPLNVTWSFRPRLKLMWPAGLMTSNLSWVEKERAYYITEETNCYVGVVGSPTARDISLMPYQEEPRDVPVRFVVEAPIEAMKKNFIPIVITGSVEGRAAAKANYERILAAVPSLYEKNVAYYERFQKETVNVTTPDERLNRAFEWAKIGVEKGVATNPHLGTGLVAGFRTSGESERPGFAWFFGRDALWTMFAINSYGDFATTRTALEFLKKYQRADGKIPHEISQSAGVISWFTEYQYPWASADATPLYVAAHADYWRASGDTDLIRAHWQSIKKAYRFAAATDTDGNGLIENTKFGHGWVEGGALHPLHEEIYMQGVWIEASRSIAELAGVMNEPELAAAARAGAERTRAAIESTYWLADRGFYAFATNRPPAKPREAEPGPNRIVRQARMNELDKATLIDEDTILPAVPLWWGTLQDDRAQLQIDHLGAAAMATDWGARLISEKSRLYDPLSYHYGSVWPLFTGWAAMGAYRYNRPHVGYQALTANALLSFTEALGYVTELISGEVNTPFGRSSHHQVWSEAMIVTPLLRGLLGIEANDGGRSLRFAPQLPADWNQIAVSNFAAGPNQFDLTLERGGRRETIKIVKRAASVVANTAGNITPGIARQIVIAPSFPLDARVRSVKVNNRTTKFNVTRAGDIQRAEVVVDNAPENIEAVFTYDEGTDVYVQTPPLKPGAHSEGLRVLRARADANALRLTLEGRGGRSYALCVRTPRRLGESGVTAKQIDGGDYELLVAFDGTPGIYGRRELTIPLYARGKSSR
ncbi:MAG: amylo-alpha-1,6-glucosidase [Pyrinomonadaceae bacterium]|nr:amylo-alpha-1,6-glucosidase [Pyrinomonadaceae bacterium]